MNITPNKLTISQLFASSNEQFIVPAYQRRYAWRYRQYLALYEDIEMLKDNDGHLFGMIILHTHLLTGGLNKPELVDGQQRLTTLIILLKAIQTVYKQNSKDDKILDIEKMLFCKGLDDIKHPKIKLGDLDNEDIKILIHDYNLEEIKNENIYSAFIDYKDWLAALSIDELNKFYYRLTNIAVIIRLDVGLAQDAYKLFETINNRGLKLTPTDIIKNFLLGHAAKINSPEKNILEKVKQLWSEIIINLDNIDTDDFLRHFICSRLNRRVSTSYVVHEFKKYYMKTVYKAEILGEFDYYEFDDEGETEEEFENDIYDNNDEKENFKIDIVDFLIQIRDLSIVYKKINSNLFDDKRINRRVENLNKILSKPSYIFLMYFLKKNIYSTKEKIAILKFIETLMLRRHICESRTNENDDIFAKIVSFIGKEDLLGEIKQFIQENEFMPSDFDFEQSLPKYQFKGKLINRAKYILEHIEYYLQGNTNELILSSGTEVELEHIIPQSIITKKSKDSYGDWESYLGENSAIKHKKFVNLMGNLTLLKDELNLQAYNNPFAKKKSSYRKSSLKITNELADQADFRFNHVSKRGEQLTQIAMKIWEA